MQNKFLLLLMVEKEEEEEEDIPMVLRKPHVQMVPMAEVLQQGHTESNTEEEAEEEGILLDVVCKAEHEEFVHVQFPRAFQRSVDVRVGWEKPFWD